MTKPNTTIFADRGPIIRADKMAQPGQAVPQWFCLVIDDEYEHRAWARSEREARSMAREARRRYAKQSPVRLAG